MSDTKSGDDKTLSVSTKKKLSTKRSGAEQSTVRQNFSHGRTNNVVVETKPKRRVAKPQEREASSQVKAGLKPRSADGAAAGEAPAQEADAPQAGATGGEAATAPSARAEEGGAAPASAPSRPAKPTQPTGRPQRIELGPKPGAAPSAAPEEPAAEDEPVAEAPAAPAGESEAAPAPAAESAQPTPASPAAAESEAAPAETPKPAESAPARQSGGAGSAQQSARGAGQGGGAAQGSQQGAQQRGQTGQQRSTGRDGGGRSAGGAAGSRSGGRDDRSGQRGGRDDRRQGQQSGSGRQPRGAVLSDLSSREMDARKRALELAKQREAEDRRQFQEQEARRVAEDERRQREREDAERRQAEEQARVEAEAEERRVAEQKKSEAPAETGAPASPADAEAAAARGTGRQDARRRPGGEDEARGRPASKRPGKGAEQPKRNERDAGRRQGKLTLDRALSGDEGGRGRSLSSMRRRQEKQKRGSQQSQPREKIAREVTVPETISIQELANRMSERSVDVVKYLMQQGQMMKPGDIIDADTAELLVGEFGHTLRRVAESDVEEGLFDVADDPAKQVGRPPVVTIMGHVDHGKTSLLDAIRHTRVTSGEAGGITQHIGAYQVEQGGQTISFIDTPGHAAFSAMRARGANTTDIAILVVAADDSVMPQTIESINHAKAAGVPMIVAINKMDKPEADANKVRTELLQHEVFVESMGGEVLDVEVSAAQGTNLDKLLEAILLQSELLELKADPTRTAEGAVIEAELDKGRGPVATVLVETGTLKQGDVVVAGDEWGRVRALVNDRGEQMKEAPPSMPVEILGMQGTPQAGDRFAVVENEAKAREISEYRHRSARERQVAKSTGQRGSLEQMMSQMQESGLREFPLVIKGDVQGSVEAIIGSLDNISTEEVKATVVHSGAGAITESDVSLAAASDAALIGFNVRANKQAREAAQREGIELRYYNVIYDLVDDVKKAMSGLLSPERRETFLGNAEIQEVFNISKVGKVAGCRVTEGKVERGSGVRLIRDGVVIHEGTLKTLKRFKDEVSEVPGGQECGMAFQNYEDIRAGDVIENFRVEHVARSL